MWRASILLICNMIYANTSFSLEPVTVFVSKGCIYCELAQAYLDKHQIIYKVINVTQNKSQRLALYKQTGQSTVPYIFNCSNFIGGYNQLIKIDLETLRGKCV